MRVEAAGHTDPLSSSVEGGGLLGCKLKASLPDHGPYTPGALIGYGWPGPVAGMNLPSRLKGGMRRAHRFRRRRRFTG
jgi:hypothetical protein